MDIREEPAQPKLKEAVEGKKPRALADLMPSGWNSFIVFRKVFFYEISQVPKVLKTMPNGLTSILTI